MKKHDRMLAGGFIMVLVSISAFGYSGGSGSEETPYLIANKTDLFQLADNTNDYDKCFKLTSDIDLSGENFTNSVIAFDTDSSDEEFNGTPFTGTFDGDNYSIINLSIVSSNDFIGFFGCLKSGSEIRDLEIEDADISGGNRAGVLVGFGREITMIGCLSSGNIHGSNQYVGGLIGYGDNSVISNCCSSVRVSGSEHVGGLIGKNYESTVSYCCSTGNVSGINYIGGFVGESYDGDINNCYCSCGTLGQGSIVAGFAGHSFSGTINCCYSAGTTWGHDYVAGLVGSNRNCMVSDCYASGWLFANMFIGGLIGNNDAGILNNCYSVVNVYGNNQVGGLVGYNASSYVSNCFWDTEISGQPDSACGIAKTTAEMQTLSTFTNAGWNFDTIWTMGEYPVFQWQSYSGGLGTEENPFLIGNKADLIDLRSSTNDYDKYFRMIADIDLSGESFTNAVIAFDIDSSNDVFDGTEFTGTFDADGYMVTNLIISSSGGFVGLFGHIGSSGTVSNLLVSGSVEGLAASVGALCGFNEGKISLCSVFGRVDGFYGAGGLCGYNEGEISLCSSMNTVYGNFFTGGLCGINRHDIYNCYSLSSVDGESSVGGLCGSCSVSAQIIYSYSAGAVRGKESVGGLCGENSGNTPYASFWDTDVSGLTNSAGGVGKTTVEMQSASTFTDAGWNFEDTWFMQDYPVLLWQCDAYDIWTQNCGIPAEERGYWDCPAEDHIQNLLKYAIGLDPMSVCSFENVMRPIAYSNEFAIIYHKSKEAADVELFPTWTYSLIIPNWQTDGFEFEIIDESSSNETWKATLNLTNNCGYIKLNAYMPD